VLALELELRERQTAAEVAEGSVQMRSTPELIPPLRARRSPQERGDLSGIYEAE